MELKDKIEKLEAELKALKNEIKTSNRLEHGNGMVIGKWNRTNCMDSLVFIEKFDKEMGAKGYGFKNDEWYYPNKFYWSTMGARPVTDKEVKDALINEAIKRGVKKGVKIKCLHGWSEKAAFWYNKKDVKFVFCNNGLWVEGLSEYTLCVFQDGKWAEIIKDEKIMIGGYVVRRHQNGKDTTIDGNLFTKEFWEASKIVSEHSKAKIMVGCSKQFDVSLETINKILDKLKHS